MTKIIERRLSTVCLIVLLTILVLQLPVALFPGPLLEAAEKVYWTDSAALKIQRANFDGTAPENFISVSGGPRAVALDLAGSKIYWALSLSSGGKIQRANLDGTAVEDLVVGLAGPNGIALDANAGKIYWTLSGVNVSDIRKIQRANLDGTTVEDIITTGLSIPVGIALDLANGKIYWTDVGNDKIKRANLDGTSIEELVTTGLVAPQGIALDVPNGKMYWADFSAGKIQRADLDGFNVQDIRSGLSGPRFLALDSSKQKIYWTDSNAVKIQRANFDGSNLEDIVTTGLMSPYGIALELDSDSEGPVTASVMITLNPVSVNNDIGLTANVDDSDTGGSTILQAEYTIDGGSPVMMVAQDGVFDQVTENVSAIVPGFQSPGVYEVCVDGTDAAGNLGHPECTFIAVYDPHAGFVTGGGWIHSPQGAYRPDPSLDGKANFGFVAKYHKGATVPTGATEFQFKIAQLSFRSDTYQWLVVAGSRAQFKGIGTVNSVGNYNFLLTAIDGQVSGGGGFDKFRIKIWEHSTGTILYDNKLGSDDFSNDATELGGGSIVIHAK